MSKMVEEGRIEEVQTEASDIGCTLLRLSYYNLSAIQEGLAERVHSIGRELHLVETMPLYMDGGRSMQAALERVNREQELLREVVTEVEQS
jgi:hypothetical protein